MTPEREAYIANSSEQERKLMVMIRDAETSLMCLKVNLYDALQKLERLQLVETEDSNIQAKVQFRIER